ncbi:MAG: Gfo/Idh/MocA family protein [Spirochaetia bacterium]
MKRIKVGVIGTGFIGPAHIEALRRLPGVDVVALADAGDQQARAKAEELGVEKSFGDYKDLLKDKAIDLVHICTPNNLHYQMTKDALAAGKHVVCEKPLATDSAEGRELVALADRAGLVCAVHFNIRYYPLMAHVRAMIGKGEIGDLFTVQGSYLQDWLFYDTDYNWRLEPAVSGKSRAVADIGSHWMDLVEHLTGRKIAEVSADFATFHPTRRKPLKPVETFAGKLLKPEDYAAVPISTEDYATVMIRFAGGAHGVLTVSQVSAGRKNRLYFEIDGSKKSVAWESELPNQVWIGRRDGPNELLLRDPSLVHPESQELISFPGGHNEGFPDTSKQMFKQVIAAVRGGRDAAPPNARNTAAPNPRGTAAQYPTFRDGLRELLLCDAILESSRTGAWVKAKEA